MVKKVKDIEKIEAKLDCVVDQIADLAALMLQLLINQDRFGVEITKSLSVFKQELSTLENSLANLEKTSERRFSNIERNSDDASRLVKIMEVLVRMPYLSQIGRCEVDVPVQVLDATDHNQ